MRQATVSALARYGYGARAVVYVIIGGLAALAALGSPEGETTDPKGAFLAILRQPSGTALLGLVAAGLAAYAAWNFLQAVADTDRLGRNTRGLVFRAALLISACGHLLLSFVALNMIFGWLPTGASSEQDAKDWTAWLLAQPFGPWIVGGIGVAVVVGGIGGVFSGCKGTYARRLSSDSRVRAWAMPIGRCGMIAQGSVFVLAGIFLITAALRTDPTEARGLAGTLATLRGQDYGWVPFTAVAFGLVAFGAYGLIEVVFRKVEAPPAQHQSVGSR